MLYFYGYDYEPLGFVDAENFLTAVMTINREDSAAWGYLLGYVCIFEGVQGLCCTRTLFEQVTPPRLTTLKEEHLKTNHRHYLHEAKKRHRSIDLQSAPKTDPGSTLNSLPLGHNRPCPLPAIRKSYTPGNHCHKFQRTCFLPFMSWGEQNSECFGIHALHSWPKQILQVANYG
jgi:hypothetical protein